MKHKTTNKDSSSGDNYWLEQHGVNKIWKWWFMVHKKWKWLRRQHEMSYNALLGKLSIRDKWRLMPQVSMFGDRALDNYKKRKTPYCHGWSLWDGRFNKVANHRAHRMPTTTKRNVVINRSFVMPKLKDLMILQCCCGFIVVEGLILMYQRFYVWWKLLTL